MARVADVAAYGFWLRPVAAPTYLQGFVVDVQDVQDPSSRRTEISASVQCRWTLECGRDAERRIR